MTEFVIFEVTHSWLHFAGGFKDFPLPFSDLF